MSGERLLAFAQCSNTFTPAKAGDSMKTSLFLARGNHSSRQSSWVSS